MSACGGDVEGSGEPLLPGADSGANDDSGLNDGGVGSDATSSSSTLDGDGGYARVDEDSACAASSLSAAPVVVEKQVEVQVEVKKPAPVALYVMFDRSMSMGSYPGIGSNIWPAAVQAFKNFVNDGSSSGMDIALQFFPHASNAAESTCSTEQFKTPMVGPVRLPAGAATILDTINKQGPNGYGTPIEGALRGVTEYCKSFQAAHPTEKCVTVLITDGKPEYAPCETDFDKIAAIAGKAWTDFGVRTYAVGLKGADFGLLDKIAKQGGAVDCDTNSATYACNVSAGTDKLEEALGKIRDTVTTTETHVETQTHTEQHALECTWKMPTPSAGQTVDLASVNVTISGGAKAALELGRVPDAAACQPSAWYYDNASNPTQINACPETCADMKSGGYTDVKILLGCETRVLIW